MDNGADHYRRFLAGDEDGFVALVRDYKDGLILYLNTFVRDWLTAEELAEDTFVRLGLKRPVFSERSSFRTWLYAIGRHCALDYLRKQARHRVLPLEAADAETAEAAETPEVAYVREERDRVLHAAMQHIRVEYRQVLWLVYFEGFSNKETARIMQKSVHAIETLTYRARQSLKAELNREGFSYEDV